MSPARAVLLVFALLAGAFLLPSPSPAAGPVSLPALAPLPLPTSPPENPTTPEKVNLGKMLFFDRRLSGDGTMNCATCHDPENGFADALPISLSYPTTRNWRNSPGLVNVAYRKTLFHDGRATSLEEQALFPMMSPFERNRNLDYLEEVLKTVPAYVEAFQAVFGGEITRQRVAMAIAAFERTLLSRDTPLDRHLRGEPGALSARQRAGLALFLGKVSGFPDYRTLREDPGHFLVTKDPADWKAFATPSLREVAATAPYMHNGALPTLVEVIEFYDRGGRRRPEEIAPVAAPRPVEGGKGVPPGVPRHRAIGENAEVPPARHPLMRLYGETDQG